MTIVNTLIECAVTGLFSALFLLLAARLGLLPLVVMSFMASEDDEGWRNK